MNQPIHSAVHVCFDRDIECGDFERNWCATCPKRKPIHSADAAEQLQLDFEAWALENGIDARRYADTLGRGYWDQGNKFWLAYKADRAAAQVGANDCIDCPKCIGSSVVGEVRGIRCSNCEGRGYVVAAGAPAETPKPVYPELEVWCGPMPESNGKANFTAILRRKGADFFDEAPFTIARSEYPDRVRYEADCVRHIIGELAERPFILDYDEGKHSGYVAPTATIGAGEGKDAARDVLAERDRQMDIEGWTHEVDDQYTHHEMPLAAACYATGSRVGWPWSKYWWKPGTDRRNLVKAGALILAEIERLDRAAMRSKTSPGEAG